MTEKSHVGMTQCFFCGEGKDVLLDRRLRNTLPRMALYDMNPCQKCEGMMAQGVMLIAYDENKTNFSDTIKLPNPERAKNRYAEDQIDTGIPNFHRTGCLCVIKEDAVERMPIPDEMKAQAIKKRVLFLADEVWDAFGLPRGEVAGIPTG